MSDPNTPRIAAHSPIADEEEWTIEFRARVRVTGVADNGEAHKAIAAGGFPRAHAQPLAVIATRSGARSAPPNAMLAVLIGGSAFDADLRAFMTVRSTTCEGALEAARAALMNDPLVDDLSVDYHVENLRPAAP